MGSVNTKWRRIGGGRRQGVSCTREIRRTSRLESKLHFSGACSPAILSADRKSVGNGGRRREQRTCRNKTSLRGTAPAPLLRHPRSATAILTTRQDIHTGRYNRRGVRLLLLHLAPPPPPLIFSLSALYPTRVISHPEWMPANRWRPARQDQICQTAAR